MRADLLNGIRVVELGSAWAGPFAARLLADLGAEVIKVEAPRHPDLVRFSVYLDNDPGELPWERGAHFQKFSRNKKGCVIDVANPRGLELFTRLLQDSDVLVENNTPRTRNQLGLTDDYLRAHAPGLVIISMHGFGSYGPYRDYLAYGITIEGFAGLSSVTGYADEQKPVRSTIPYGDPVAAAFGVLAALAGLRARKLDGTGTIVELSQHEGLTAMLPDLFIRAQLEGIAPGPAGNDDALLYAPHDAFPCAGDNAWVALAVETHEQWEALCRLLGRADLLPRTTHEERDAFVVREAIEVWTSARDRDEAANALQDAGIPAGPVLSPAEMFNHDQVQARGMYEPVEHPLYRTLDYARMPLLFRNHLQIEGDMHAPLFGEHNRYVFEDILGLAPEEVDELYAAGVTANRPDMA